jgi:hypothetical protein
MAKVTIDIPWGKDKEQETIFEVFSALNLNDEPSLAVSILIIIYYFYNNIHFKCILHIKYFISKDITVESLCVNCFNY